MHSNQAGGTSNLIDVFTPAVIQSLVAIDMRTCVFLFISMMSTACMSVAERDRGLAMSEGSELVYLRDPRTGLCFAGRALSFNNAVLTNVPCTEAVLRMIAAQSSETTPRP